MKGRYFDRFANCKPDRFRLTAESIRLPRDFERELDGRRNGSEVRNFYRDPHGLAHLEGSGREFSALLLLRSKYDELSLEFTGNLYGMSASRFEYVPVGDRLGFA